MKPEYTHPRASDRDMDSLRESVTAVQSASQIDSQFADGSELLAKLEHLVGLLQKKLAPVAMPRAVSNSAGEAVRPPDIALTQRASQMRDLNRQFAIALNQLEAVVESVDC